MNARVVPAHVSCWAQRNISGSPQESRTRTQDACILFHHVTDNWESPAGRTANSRRAEMFRFAQHDTMGAETQVCTVTWGETERNPQRGWYPSPRPEIVID
jgi:hypothetical protein